MLPPDASLTPRQVQANIRHLVLDITWYGILVGTTINLMQVYVVRLGAPSVLVGAVTYGPALVNVFWLVPAARLVRRTGHRMRFVVLSGLANRFCFLLVALLPFVVHRGLVEVTVLVLIIQAFATAPTLNGFLALMADSLPPDQVAQTVSWRQFGFGITSTLSTLLAGLLLARLPAPLNYQVLFVIGFMASLGSEWHVAHLVAPESAPVNSAAGRSREQIGSILRVPRFAGYLAIVSALQMTLGMVAPLMPLFAVRHLGSSDAQISLVITAGSASSVIGSLLLRGIARRANRERVLAGGILGYLFYPLLLSFAPTIEWVILFAVIGGFFSAVIAVTLFDNLVAICPEGDKTNYIAVYNVFTNIALFAGPLLAGLLATGTAGPALGLQVAAAICAAAVILAVLWMRGVQQPETA